MKREEKYLSDHDHKGIPYRGYIFFFHYSGKSFGIIMLPFVLYDIYFYANHSIDATGEQNVPGRYINHSRKNANLLPRLVPINNQPRILFFSSREIQEGEELVYDYNDHTSEAIASHPWLTN